jgi:hypothetical protein
MAAEQLAGSLRKHACTISAPRMSGDTEQAATDLSLIRRVIEVQGASRRQIENEEK